MAALGPVAALERLVAGVEADAARGRADRSIRRRALGRPVDGRAQTLEAAERVGSRAARAAAGGAIRDAVAGSRRRGLAPAARRTRGARAVRALGARRCERDSRRLEQSIALVGARAATGYGEHVTIEAASGLVDRGFAIVSGAAYGIDGAAHRAALASQGTTVAVLAGGLDRFYPSGHEQLLGRIADRGVVVAEVPPGTTPTKWRFLLRNRLIAALSGATVVRRGRLALRIAQHGGTRGHARAAARRRSRTGHQRRERRMPSPAAGVRGDLRHDADEMAELVLGAAPRRRCAAAARPARTGPRDLTGDPAPGARRHQRPQRRGGSNGSPSSPASRSTASAPNSACSSSRASCSSARAAGCGGSRPRSARRCRSESLDRASRASIVARVSSTRAFVARSCSIASLM